MELATFAKLVGLVIAPLLHGLTGAAQPFSTPREAVLMPAVEGAFVPIRAEEGSARETGDPERLTIRRAGAGYRVDFLPYRGELRSFSARLVRLGGGEGEAPVYFLDMTPVSPAPEGGGASHFALALDWDAEGMRLATIDPAWVSSQLALGRRAG
ncbi:MAG: hypothetical protein KGL53_02295, partial [Elusimicrobia bacterium]|nr:hypothetical protein [Elusimicrobiota bacterium]